MEEASLTEAPPNLKILISGFIKRKNNGIFDESKYIALQQIDLKNFDLQKQLEDILFLKESCDQINKDLRSFTQFQIILTEGLLDTPLESLIDQLSPIIVDMEDHHHLQNFMYTVDLPEKQYIEYRSKQKSLSHFALKIIERCVQKVTLRQHFSNPQKD